MLPLLSGFTGTLWREYHERMATPTRDAVFDIRAFGAVGDGNTDNTRAFNAAMRAVHASGGGVEVVVPTGIWLTAPFNLTSRLTLNITRDATLLASDDQAQWPVIAPLPSYGQGRDHVGPRRTSCMPICGSNPPLADQPTLLLTRVGPAVAQSSTACGCRTWCSLAAARWMARGLAGGRTT